MKIILNALLLFVLVTTAEAQKIQLALNLKKGEIYHQYTEAKANVIQTLGGQEINMTMLIKGKMSYKVTNIKNSNYEMQVWYDSLSLGMGTGSKIMEYSSENEDETDVFSTILGAMKNKPFYVKMTSTGKVDEVKNIDTLFTDLFTKFTSLPESKKEQIKDQLKKSYGEKAFKGNIEMVSAVFPDKPVAIGDKWKVNTKLESGMSGNIETTYQLKEVKGANWIIVGTSKIKTADKEAYIQTNGKDMQYDIDGTMTSEISAHKENGWIETAKIHQDIKGKVIIKGETASENMEVPMNMTNEMTISEK